MGTIDKVKQLRHKVCVWSYTRKPICNNKVIMWANSFKHFGCSPKYIALYLLKHYPGQFDIVWVFDESAEIPIDLPKEIRVVRYFSLAYLKELHTARFIICNARTSAAYYWNKRKGQIYIQTWHSSIRLKKIEGDAEASLGEKYIEAAKQDSRKIDLLISGCDFSTDIFQRAFWYNGSILKSGTPRCDVLITGSDDAKRKVYKYYNIKQGKKLLLYAPTFRNDKKADIYGMDFIRLQAALERSDRTAWVMGCRLHPNILEEFNENGSISMSKYSDMQELIAATDVLITDYSSCMFDTAIARKPCILYVPDLGEYIEKERGLYFDIGELPFPLAQNMDELVRAVTQFDNIEYQNRLDRFLTKIGTYEDGHATERVANYILEKSGK